jgi:hypothetical protein
LRARGAAVGTDDGALPSEQGICPIGWSIRPHAEGRSPKTSSVVTKTTRSSASTESCGPKIESIRAHDRGISLRVSGAPTSSDSFRRFKESIPTSS